LILENAVLVEENLTVFHAAFGLQCNL